MQEPPELRKGLPLQRRSHESPSALYRAAGQAPDGRCSLNCYLPRACPFSLWYLFTVAAAIAFARFAGRPCFNSLSLMCSYMRCSLSLTLGKCCLCGMLITS